MIEERIVLEMDMADYGYITNTLKKVMRNALGNPHDKTSIPCSVSLDILSNSEVVKEDVTPNNVIIKGLVHTLTEAANAVANGTADSGTIVDILDTASTLGTLFLADDEPKSKSQIEMSEEEWNKIRNGAMPETKAKNVRLKKPISGTYKWCESNMPVYGPDPCKELNEKIEQLEERMTDAECDIKGIYDSDVEDILDDHKDRIAELYEDVNNIKDLFKSCDNADKALHRRLLSIENQLGREFYDYKNKVALDIASIDNRFSDYDERIAALSNKTDRLHEMCEANDSRRTGLHIKLDNKIDILEERLKNTAETVDNLRNIVTGEDDSLDERIEGLKHTMECLIDRDHNFFDKVKDLTERHNKLQMRLNEVANKIDKKDKNDKLDISSASFNVYFSKDNNEEDDDE